MNGNRDDQAVAQGHGMLDHVQMAVGYGVKGAGIERDTGHANLLTRLGRPRKRAWFPVQPPFYFRSAHEPESGSKRLLGGPAMFRPLAATKQNSARMKPFSGPAKTAGNLW